MVAMRKVREREAGRLVEAMAEAGRCSSGLGRGEEFEVFLRVLGNLPDREAVADAAEDAGLLPAEEPTAGVPRTSLRLRPVQAVGPIRGLPELWRLVDAYRANEGLPRTDVAELQRCLRQYGQQGRTGLELAAQQLGKALRWLGYPTARRARQRLLSEVHADGSGRLDFEELAKLVRKLREEEATKMRLTFEEYDLEATGTLSRRQCQYALRSLSSCLQLGQDSVVGFGSSDHQRRLLGHPPGEASVREGVDIYAFVVMATRLRRQARALLRDSAGFTPHEVENLWQDFQESGPDGHGEIGHHELVRVLQRYSPELAFFAMAEPLAGELQAEAELRLGFQDFLRLVRYFLELRSEAQAGKERRAASSARFTREEVEGFRELFAAEASGERGEARLSFDDVARMIGGICPLHMGHLAELETAFLDAAGEEGPGLQGLAFPEFLLLLRQLLDCDFAGLEEHSRRAAGRKAAVS